MTNSSKSLIEKLKAEFRVDSLQSSDWQQGFNEGLDEAIAIIRQHEADMEASAVSDTADFSAGNAHRETASAEATTNTSEISDNVLGSKPDFHADSIEQLAFELAFELEDAELSRNDYVTVNREKLLAIAKRVHERITPKPVSVSLEKISHIIAPWMVEPHKALELTKCALTVAGVEYVD